MVFPEVNPSLSPPMYAAYCIDYRYDALSSEFLRQIKYGDSYYLATAAGAALSLGYKDYCKNECCSCSCSSSSDYCKTCPVNPNLNTLKKSLVTNLNIALTLKPDMNVVYFLNHQDCGAIRAYLSCSGYPKKDETGEAAKIKEICINAKLLTYADKYFNKKFKGIIKDLNINLGLLDANGAVADYDIKTKAWTVIYVPTIANNPNALWFKYTKGQVVKFNCKK